MTITVRQVRHGCTIVRLTGAHARLLNGLVADMLGSAHGLAQVGEVTTLPAQVELGEASPAALEPTGNWGR